MATQFSNFLIFYTNLKSLIGNSKRLKFYNKYNEAWITQLVAHQLGTMEVMGSNPARERIFIKNLNLNVA